jgi:hypothetical protein
MKKIKIFLGGIMSAFLLLFLTYCTKEEIITEEVIVETIIRDTLTLEEMLKEVKPVFFDEEPTAGNNLSFPVIWSDGFAKTLREPPIPGEVLLEGEWWYVWGEDPIDPDAPIYSCKPNSLAPTLCEDGSVPGDGSSTVYRAYIQKVASNVWQADNIMATEPLNVDLVDWGDNLESIDWGINSHIRVEVVLFENLATPVVEYAMRHVDSWGSDEVHGLQTELDSTIIYGPGTQATVYSHNARLTIQKLNVPHDSIAPGALTWVPNLGWTETNAGEDLVNEPIFNQAVYEAGDGPGYYNAEVNVKGKIIYGYTWTARHLNEDVGDYRLTFSFDESGGVVPLNTFFDDLTAISLPIEEEVTTESEDSEGNRGGVAVIDPVNNLTYMDITIKEGGGGQGGGGGHSGGGQGGGGQGGGGGGHSDGGH